MDNLPTIKNFEIDYSFIIKNYLNPELWHKKWNLFTYKSFVFSLELNSIYVQDEKIYFYMTLEDILNTSDYEDDWVSNPSKCSTVIDYSLKIDNVSFLKNKINSAMLALIEKLEERKIKKTEEYKNIKNSERAEEERLTKIAEDFLDDNNVTNEDIRDVYISNYVSNNSKIDEYLNDCKYKLKYNMLTDLYLIYANINKKDDLLKTLENRTLNTEEFEELKTEINEYIEYIETENFEEEMQENLEDI